MIEGICSFCFAALPDGEDHAEWCGIGKELPVHPVCAIFPMMSDAELQALADDIRENGLLEPGVVFFGELIDGRNRREACRIAGTDFEVRDFEGEGSEVHAWIISKNLHRRHLDTSQRAMVAARLATLRTGERPDPEAPAITTGQAAEMLGVGTRSVESARRVLREAPELAEQIDRGAITVDGALRTLKASDEETPRISPHLRRSAEVTENDPPSSVPADPEHEEPAPRSSAQLPNDQRAKFDAYYTPLRHALAICRWLATRIPTPRTILEPSVGGGMWVRAARIVWPDAVIDRQDINPDAEGLRADLREGEEIVVGDFREGDLGKRWDLILGNPPYEGDLHGWCVRSIASADHVAYLLRDSFTGSAERLPWWRSSGRPAVIVKTLPRPKWEGPGERTQTDKADTVEILWSGQPVRTDYDWLDVSVLTDADQELVDGRAGP